MKRQEKKSKETDNKKRSDARFLNEPTVDCVTVVCNRKMFTKRARAC